MGVLPLPHRSSLWREKKRHRNSQGAALQKSRRGRRFKESLGGVEETFIYFAGAVIQSINEEGACDYSKIMNAPNSSGKYRYRDAPAPMLHAIGFSGFPPGMIAVAAAALGKLNFKTYVPRKSNRSLLKRAKSAALTSQKKEWTTTGMQKALNNEKLREVLRRDGYDPNIVDEYASLAAADGYSSPWVIEFLSKWKSPEDRTRGGDALNGAAPLSRQEEGEDADFENECHGPFKSGTVGTSIRNREPSKKGTAASSIKYAGGVKLSRQMASYYRRHKKFPGCIRFLSSLVTRRANDGSAMLPERPLPPTAWAAPTINEQFNEFMRLRRKERLTKPPSASKRSPSRPKGK